ncbi:ATP-binding cassette domain-containing protein [Curtobacterium pusillum]|nr:ABC transporter ATP-binding protein [Curtobacterium pusillum]GLK32535.1 ABC transporter ATP-binding protein [Curtobacterium pusillum]
MSARSAAPVTDVDAPGIEFRDVTVCGDDGRVILDSLSMAVPRGEIVALLGPSGAGKTTALRAVAGFQTPAAGQVLLGGRDVTRVAPRDRGIGMVVQSYALFPHMSVGQNVAYGLRSRGVRRRDCAGRVRDALAMVGMEPFADRRPSTLSGGQQQRVAIARALAPRPEVLLLDEPLSALDAQLRSGMLAELARLHRELPDVTMLYVTHGQDEALALADRIAVMADARLVEYGGSESLYRDPEYAFTAGFLGAANLLDGDAVDAGTVRVAGADASVRTVERLDAGDAVRLAVRPHRVRLLDGTDRATNELVVTVTDVQWRGATHHVTGTIGAQSFSAELLELALPPTVGSSVRLGFEPQDVVVVRDGRHLDDGRDRTATVSAPTEPRRASRKTTAAVAR